MQYAESVSLPTYIDDIQFIIQSIRKRMTLKVV